VESTFSPIVERNSDGWQKGFTNVTPKAPHDSATSKWQIFFSGICDAEGGSIHGALQPPAAKPQPQKITLQEKSGSVARSTGEALAEPF
jgi:hypothetical protein